MRYSVLLLAALAGPLAAQPALDSTAADPPGLYRWTRADGEGPGFGGLPVRSVREVAALVPGVVPDPGTGALVFRARPGVAPPSISGAFDAQRAGQEPGYVVDGMQVAGRPVLPFEAVDEVAVLTGYVPARYGDAAGGLVLVETRKGGDRYGAHAEGITSQGLDAYGYNLAAFSVHGPLGRPSLGRFFLTGEARRLSDATPYGGETHRLADEAYADLLANPQVVRLTDAAGEVRYAPFPWEAAQAAASAGQPFTEDDLRGALDVPAGFDLAGPGPISAAQTYTAERFERTRANDDPLRALALSGSATLDATPTLRLRLGGVLDRERYDRTAAPAERYASQLYNRDRLYGAERDAGRAFASLRQQLGEDASYELQAGVERWRTVQYPHGFSDDPADALFYGDIDDDYNAIARRYFVFRGGQYEPLYTTDGGDRPGRAGGTFFLPGRPATVYRKREGAALRLSGDATVRLGAHEVGFGGAFEQRTHRRFDLDGAGLARFYADGAAESGPGYGSYDELPFGAVRHSVIARYGYDYLGLAGAGTEDIDAYFDVDPATGERGSTAVAPYRPRYYAGYVQDRVTWQALTLDLGLRVEAFDNNALALRDPYAVVPIVRAGSLDAVPDGIADDFAVYFDPQGRVVGYRDLDGRFYTDSGLESTAETVGGHLSGQVVRDEGAPRSAAFQRTPVRAVLEPRLGLRLPVSDRTSLHAYYSRTARRPPAELYASFHAYEQVTGQDVVGNAALRPEVVDDFGVGVRVRPTGPVRAEATAFYRRYSDLAQRRTLVGGLPSYRTYLNVGAVSGYGVDLAVTLARTRGTAIRANYTLSFTDGTGSDAAITGSVVWQGASPPNVTSPADFDTRHALDVVADYRFADGAGPGGWGGSLLDGFGVGAVLTAQSGRPYTKLSAAGFSVGDAFTSSPDGGLNEARLPWTAQLDLRLDREFRAGPGTVTAFLWVENLLDAHNVVAVYRATGEPDDDGFLDSPSGQVYVNSAPDPSAGTFNYLAYVGGPVNIGGVQSTGHALFYGPPRRVRLGLRLAL